MNVLYHFKMLPVYLRSLYFNFHYLPLKQAVKLPILIGKMHIVDGGGQVIIDSPNVYRGMIRLGFCIAHTYSDSGISWENKGSTVIFKGTAVIGNATFMCLGSKSKVVFGEDFVGGAGFKLVSTEGIEFGRSVRFGWDTLIMDSNMHPLWDMKLNQFRKSQGKIKIGNYNWFATGSKVMHSVDTPDNCVFGCNSVVTKKSEMRSFCLMSGTPAKIVCKDVCRKIGDKEDVPLF